MSKERESQEMYNDPSDPIDIREYNHGKTKTYVMTDIKNKRIWCDAKAFAFTTWMCAYFDGEVLGHMKIDDEMQTFVCLDWLLEEYKDDEKIIGHLCRLKKNIYQHYGWE